MAFAVQIILNQDTPQQVDASVGGFDTMGEAFMEAKTNTDAALSEGDFYELLRLGVVQRNGKFVNVYDANPPSI